MKGGGEEEGRKRRERGNKENGRLNRGKEEK
jgi:hypothetical protein